MAELLNDGEDIEIASRGDHWISSWHSPRKVPDGKMHGAAGICVADDGSVVIISTDRISWDFPAGRPEGDEVWEDTLRREMLEEACAVVTDARILGYVRGRRVENGVIRPAVVRSIWLADIQLLDWDPQFEIRHRKLVPPAEAISLVLPEFEPIWKRAFHEAGLG